MYSYKDGYDEERYTTAAATTTTTTTTPRTTITTVQTPTTTHPSTTTSTVKVNYFNNAYHNTFQKFGETTTRTPPSANKYAWNTKKTTTTPRTTFSTKFAFHKSTTVSPYDWLYYKTKTPASRSLDVINNNKNFIQISKSTTRSPIYANIKPSTYKSVFDVYFNQIASYKKRNNL